MTENSSSSSSPAAATPVSSSKSSVYIRPAARSLADLDALASVYQRSFSDDPWWRYLYLPRIDEAPSPAQRRAIESESLRQARATIKRILLNPQDHTFVAVDNTTEQLVGFAGWIVPDTPDSHQRNFRSLTFSERIQRYWLRFYDFLSSLLVPRGLDFLLGYNVQSRLCTTRQLDWATFVSSADARHISPHHHQEGFYRLSLCGVLPSHARKGIGQALLKWGFEKADQEDRVVYISASTKGKGAYEKAGAREIARDICYPEDRVQGGWAEIVCRREKKSDRKE